MRAEKYRWEVLCKLYLIVKENVTSVLVSGNLEIFILLFMPLHIWAKYKLWFYAYLGITKFLYEPFSISMRYFHLAGISVILLKTQTSILKY